MACVVVLAYAPASRGSCVLSSLSSLPSFRTVSCYDCVAVGLYGIMLGYVMFTLSQHITPVYLGISFLNVIGP